MKTITLSAQKRDQNTKAKDIRAQGNIPAIIYGPGLDTESTIISVEYQEFRKVFRQAGESTVVEVNLDGKEKISVLIHAVDRHPVRDEMDHIDFYAVDMKQKVHTHIPLHIIGNAPAVKEKNAIIVVSKNELNVTCLPGDLIPEITVDISELREYHDHICVRDLNVSDKIIILDTPEDVIVSATAPKIVEETAGEETTGEAETAKTEEKKEEK